MKLAEVLAQRADLQTRLAGRQVERFSMRVFRRGTFQLKMLPHFSFNTTACPRNSSG
jgi:hypothetical protein